MTASQTTHEVIGSDKVQGTSVYDTNGEKLGTIDNLVIDKRTGHVLHAVLEFGGFLGLGTDRYPLPWTMLQYDTELDGYVIPIDEHRLYRAPRYTETCPSPFVTEDGYSQRVNDYYRD